MTIELAHEFDQPLNSFVIIAIEGDPQTVGDKLRDILIDCRKNKPIQGIYIESGSTTQVITPVWNGEKY